MSRSEGKIKWETSSVNSIDIMLVDDSEKIAEIISDPEDIGDKEQSNAQHIVNLWNAFEDGTL